MSIIYISQYLLILLFIMAAALFLFSNLDRKNNYALLSLYLISLVVIAVTRPETTADTDNYYAGFLTGSFSERMEPMYALIVSFARLFPFPVLIGFTIYAIMSVKPRFSFIKKYSTSVWASVLVYMSYCYVAQDIVAMRSSVASVLLLYIIDFKLRGEKRKMLLCIFIAILFHYTAIAFFVLFFVDAEKKQRRLYLSLLLGCYILCFNGFDIRYILLPFIDISFLEYNLIHYISSTNEVYGTINGPQILRITTCVFFWINIDKIVQLYPNALLFLKIFTISLCMFPVFSSIDIMGYRFYELFSSAEILLLPICFMGALRKPVFYKTAILIYTSYFFFNSITSLAYWDPASF